MPRSSLSRLAKIAAAAVSVGVLALGAKAIAGSDSPSPAGAAGVPAVPSQAAGGIGGRRRLPPGMGAAVTGSTLDRLKAVVTATYPGTIERAMKLPDGSYVVHVIRSTGSEVHVLVGKDFRITGVEHDRFGGHHAMPGGGAPPQGATPGGAAPPAGGSTTRQ